ncbi:MAG: hypothetical protein ACRDE6_08135 [Candidatus Limnocylindria bacterium]
MPERLIVTLLLAMLAGCTSLAVPSTSAPATPGPTVQPATPTPISSPTATPSVQEIPAETPSPSPSADEEGLEVLDLRVTGCPGGVALDWSPAMTAKFHHYTALRSLADEVDTAYPPIAPAVDWGDSYVTDRFVTSAVDATLIPSEAVFSYRVMAYDSSDDPVAASPVRHARPSQVTDLGALEIEAGNDGATRLGWRAFGGLGRCFSAYRVLVGPPNGTPETTLTVVADQSTTELETAALHAGVGYAVRVEAVRTTTLGSFVVGRTETASYTVP